MYVPPLCDEQGDRCGGVGETKDCEPRWMVRGSKGVVDTVGLKGSRGRLHVGR